MSEPIDRLTASVQSFEGRVAGLERSLTVYKQGLQAEYERLHHEAEMQKKLSRYARRTWFEMMAYIFLVGLLVSDVARAYADSQWWGLVFWATQHGDGDTAEWVLRGIGLLSQVTLMAVLGRRSQVPEWIYDRVPFAEEERLHKQSRFR